MPESSGPDRSHEADVFGLPQAASGSGASRDPVESLASEYLERLRSGQHPEIDHYVALYPQYAEQIRELFPLIAALEDFKSDRELSTSRTAMPREFNLDRLGDCRIVREIGRGGMGVVFEAEQDPVGRRVAVKLLPWRLATSSRWRERFENEARTAAALKHPHIVPIYSFGEHDGMAYYIMQLVEGIGLNRAIERLREPAGILTTADIATDFATSRGPVLSRQTAGPDRVVARSRPLCVIRRGGWSQIVRIALQVVDAIRHAHRQGTLHRDIKPANLLVDLRGRVWVTDFGLALPQEEAATRSHRVAGTLRYMAPEQFLGQCDQRSDLYSFGASLYELCTLQPAFDAAEKKDLVEKITSTDPPRPRTIVPDIPRRLERVILRAMQRDSQARYQTADELLADLRQCLSMSRWWWPFR